MIPSSIPAELENLTQIEEMLIARALPIMRVYIKPGKIIVINENTLYKILTQCHPGRGLLTE